MWPLLACSLIAVTVALDRFFYLNSATIREGELLQGLANLIRGRKYAEALHECAASHGPAARVMHAALLRHDSPASELRQVVQAAGQLEVPELERKLSILATVAQVAPLIGLLGTIGGLIDLFSSISSSGGYAGAAELSRGLYRALITSAAGLMIAIPCYVVHGYLSAWVDTLMHSMERAGIEIVALLTETPPQEGIIRFRRPDRQAEND